MAGIYIYKGAVKEDLFSEVKAMITFSDSPLVNSIANTKRFNSDEARKGLEQLKRWVSTGAFKTIVLDSFIAALKKGNTEHIRQWLEDHATEPGFPTLILIGDSSTEDLGAMARVIDKEEELKELINT